MGKTTLLDSLANPSERILRLNCDDSLDARQIENRSSVELRNLIKDFSTVQIDEVQRIENIGSALKKIADLKMPVKIIVTDSSSLGIRDNVYESATGRLLEHNLYPFSLTELSDASSKLEDQKQLEARMIYGLYPEIVTDPSDAKRLLMDITNNYLYKDVLSYGGVKKPDMLQKLVRALALQLGSEVSYNELAKIVGLDKQTVENYIDLLEKSFVIFRLSSYSRNLRNEIQKGKKIFFYDNGIRNAIISNFAPLELRNDMGALWERNLSKCYISSCQSG